MNRGPASALVCYIALVDPVTLYQFELCPFCHKVKAGLEVKGIPYEKVEVNPMSKKELPSLPEDAPKKVPVVRHADDVVYDSTAILEWLDAKFTDGPQLIPDDEQSAAHTRELAKWVNDEVMFALPTVIYGTWGEALKAAQVTARTSNFGIFQNLGVRAGGPLIMHQVAKRILKKRGRDNGHAWIEETLDRFEDELGEKPFVIGDDISLADVAMHGAMTCVADFPISKKMLARPRLRSWYERVEAIRAQA